MLGSTGLFLQSKKRPVLNSNLTPQSLRDSPLGGTGKGFPDTPSVASLRVRIPSCAYLHPPSHFVTAPWRALGTEFPRPLASLRTVCAYLQPPSHFVTAPWGARGKDSPIPLLSLRSDGALGALGAAFMGGMVGKKLQFAVFVGVYAAWDHAAVLGACVERGRDDEIGGAAVRGERNVV